MKNHSVAEVSNGISKKDRMEIADELSRLLADTYALYLKTQNFHWNVTGPTFQMLHLMFEGQYKELADAVDEIAERIRALGFSVSASFSTFSKLTSIKEEKEILSADEMVRSLLQGHETLSRTAHSVFSVADPFKDQPTSDLMTERMASHEKTAWMLRSTLR